MIKVCLVGTGGISGAHIPAWDSMTDVKLTALCDIRSECLAPYPDKHQGVRTIFGPNVERC